MKGNNYFNKGQRAFMLGDLQESAKMFSKALGEEYEPVKTLLSRGAVYLTTQEYARALEDFNLVLEIDGNNERAYYYRGITYLRKREYEQAAADFDNSLFLNSQRGTAYFARGVAWTMLGEQDKALADFEQAVAFAHVEAKQIFNIFGKEPALLKRFKDLWEGQEWSTFPRIFTEVELNTIKGWREQHIDQ